MRQSLMYLSIAELKSICKEVGVSSSGKKPILVDRICNKVFGNGKIVSKPKSVKTLSQNGPITLESKIIQGQYKNDLKNREFFKQHIPNFKFTVFGMGWIKSQWDLGKQPTYKEFIEIWRTGKKAPVQDQFQYNLFTSQHKGQFSREELLAKWQEAKESNRLIAMEIINKYLKSLKSSCKFA